jgi:hypothetical protein
MRMLKNHLADTLILISLISLLFSACQPTPQPTTTPPSPILTTPTNTPQPPTPQPSPTSTPPLPLNGLQTRYQIDLTVDYYNHNASVSQVINYTNKTSVDLADLLLVVSPLYYEGSFSLIQLSDANDQTITNFSWEGINLRVPLAPPLKVGEQITLKLQYKLSFPAREGTFGVAGGQINLANWYPFIPPYDETDGWVVEDMHVVNNFMVGEYLVYESSDFEVNLKFTDRRENFKIAASAPATEVDGVLHYQLELARTFALSISEYYVIQEIEQDGVTIRSYVLPGHEASGMAAVEMAAKAIALYGELFVPYPRDLFSIIEAEFLHNMEYDGLAFISYGVIQSHNGTPQTNLTILTPHETSHQWFFSLVGNNQAREPWLDEALATYAEVLYYEKYHPEFVQWWWDNRIDSFSPKGFVNSSIYFPGGYDPYLYAVYLRGARFMQSLREAVGDEAFFAFLKDYVTSYSYKIATQQDFFTTLSKHSQVDISSILAEYFMTR